MEEIYYTIFLGDELWEDCIDDMNQCADWSMGGMLYKDIKKVENLLEHLKMPVYGFEEDGKTFSIKKLTIK